MREQKETWKKKLLLVVCYDNYKKKKKCLFYKDKIKQNIIDCLTVV